MANLNYYAGYWYAVFTGQNATALSMLIGCVLSGGCFRIVCPANGHFDAHRQSDVRLPGMVHHAQRRCTERMASLGTGQPIRTGRLHNRHLAGHERIQRKREICNVVSPCRRKCRACVQLVQPQNRVSAFRVDATVRYRRCVYAAVRLRGVR